MYTQIINRKNEPILETSEEKIVHEFFKNHARVKVLRQEYYFKENATIDSCFNTRLGRVEIDSLYIYLDI